MKILLTGSGGFIGKNLKSYLQDKFELLTPRSYELDLTDSNAVAEYFRTNDIDFVIHCGSIGGTRDVKDKNTTIEENIAMVENILSNKKAQAKVVLFGSGAMYDKSRVLRKVKEEQIGEAIPHDLYGKSKLLIAEKIKKRQDVLMLNIFGCYGYGEKESRFPSYVINQILRGKDVEINQNAVFDYLFVEDLEKIVEHFVNYFPSTRIINITPTESISLYEIARIVNTFGIKKVNIQIKTETWNNEYTGDNSLLLKNYPELQFTDIKVALAKMYNYMSQIQCEWSSKCQ